MQARQRLQRVIAADAAFLAEMRLMDYSLLLGISRTPLREALNRLSM